MTEQRKSALLPVFRFRVDFFDHGSSDATGLAAGMFSECSGLEITMEHKTVKEGGQNYQLKQLAGRVNFSTIILKRGIAAAPDLWRWFNHVAQGAYAHRFDVKITILNMDESPDGPGAMAWNLEKAMPIKFKAADLNATANEIGIEELHLVYEKISLSNS